MQVIGNLCGLCFRLIHLISNILVHLEILHLLICTALTACKSNSTKSYHDCVVLALTVGDALGEYIYIYIPANFAWAAGDGSLNCFQCSAALGSLNSTARSTWIWHAYLSCYACKPRFPATLLQTLPLKRHFSSLWICPYWRCPISLPLWVSSITFVKSLSSKTVEWRKHRCTNVNIRSVRPRLKTRVPSRFKWFWYYLCWHNIRIQLCIDALT